MKIYMFAYLFPPEYTGASIQALTLAKALRRKGVKVTFVTATPADENHDEKQHEGFPVIRIAPCKNSSNWSILCFWFRIVKVLLCNIRKYDVIHVIVPCTLHNIIPWLGMLFRKPTLVKTTLSNEIEQFRFDGKTGIEHKFNYYSTRQYHRIVCISTIIFNELIKAGLGKKRLRYIPNGVDTERFCAVAVDTKKELRQKFGLPVHGLIFAYVGVLHKRKNLEWLLKNWMSICAKLPNTYLVFAGPLARKEFMADGGGPEFADYLKEYVKQLRGDERVFFLPFTKDVEQYFQLTDFFLNPSLSEGLSNSMLEAMSCGAIPVVSATSGVADVIRHGENGYLFPINDEYNFAQVIKKCCSEPRRHTEMSLNARRTIQQHFSLAILCNSYIELYDEIVCN